MVEAMGRGQRVGVERQTGRGGKGCRQGAEFLSCWEGAAETLWMPGAPQSLQSPTLPVETKLNGPTNHILGCQRGKGVPQRHPTQQVTKYSGRKETPQFSSSRMERK